MLGFRRIGIGLLLLAVVAPTAQAAPRKVITRPDWVNKPTGEDMARLYPKRAQDEEVGGKAVITCVVTVEGLLDACGLKQEEPKGYGFGEAALAMASTFRMSPKRVDGEVVEGGQVTIPIIFSVPPNKDMPDLGDMAMILTKVGPAGPTNASLEVMPCLDGQGDCEVHALSWIAQPDGKETARILGLVKPDAGMTYAACTVAASGLLEDCELAGDVTPVTQAAALATIKALKAPPKTIDGLATPAKTVMIGFSWEWLKLGSKEMAKRHPRTQGGGAETH